MEAPVPKTAEAETIGRSGSFSDLLPPSAQQCGAEGQQQQQDRTSSGSSPTPSGLAIFPPRLRMTSSEGQQQQDGTSSGNSPTPSGLAILPQRLRMSSSDGQQDGTSSVGSPTPSGLAMVTSWLRMSMSDGPLDGTPRGPDGSLTLASAFRWVHSASAIFATGSCGLNSTGSQRRRLDVERLSVELSANVCELKSLLTFENCEHLLRGSHISKVMSCAGSTLAGSVGSAESFALSDEVVDGRLDCFLSHNWSVGRVQKFLAIAFAFNFELAVAAALVAALPIGLVCAFGFVPIDPQTVPNYIPSQFFGRLTIGPVFITSLLLIRDMLGFRRSGPLVFFDKTCIHQENADMKMAGIKRIGAFLAFADNFMVLYTPVYLKKLWTVYELACFLSLHDSSSLRMISTFQSVTYFVAAVSLWIFTLGFALGSLFGVPPQVSYVIAMPMTYWFCRTQRRWVREKVALQDVLRNFDVRKALCVVESDRVAVYRNIALLMTAVLDLPASAELDSALDSFNTLVQVELPGIVSTTLGVLAFDYKHYIGLGLIPAFAACLDAFEGFTDGTPWQATAAYMIYCLGWTFAGWPGAISLCEKASAHWLHLEGYRDIIHTAICLLCVATCVVAMDTAILHLREQAIHSIVALVALACLALGGSVFAFYIGTRTSRTSRGKSLRTMSGATSENCVSEVGPLFSEMAFDSLNLGEDDDDDVCTMRSISSWLRPLSMIATNEGDTAMSEAAIAMSEAATATTEAGTAGTAGTATIEIVMQGRDSEEYN